MNRGKVEKRRQRSIDPKTKQKILQEIESGGLSKTQIAEKFCIPKSTLSTILKNKEKLDAAIASGSTRSCKRLRKASHKDIEDKLLEWFKRVRSNNIPISGNIVKEKAKEISSSIGVADFKCSDGWLWRFQKRHNISSQVLSGELNKVNEAIVEDWMQDFNGIKDKFSDNDTFNIDETGVYFNLLPDRSLDFKGKKCHGAGKSKNRLTVVLCCNETGSEKERLWIIGKSKNPRCLNKVNRQHLPFDYTNQKSAWVDAVSFRTWLLKFQRKMAAQNRHVLLTMDNCSAHDIGGLDLPNVTVEFFPANCTSRVQPLDQGIIAAFKRYFKTKLVRDALVAVESEKPIVKWNVLQAMRAMVSSWDNVTAKTITNCFRKAWTGEKEKSADIEITGLKEPEEWNKLTEATGSSEKMSFSDFVALDDDLEISCPPNSEDKIDEPEDEENDEGDEVEKPTRIQVLEALSILQRVSRTTAELDLNFEENLHLVSRECLKHFKPLYTQKTITEYFS